MKNIVFVGAHIDDAEIWAGGTLLKHIKNNDNVIILSKNTNNKIRINEQKESLKYSKFNFRIFKNKKELALILNQIIPDILITHWPEDSHPEHKKIALDTIEAIKKCRINNKKPLKFLFCDTYNKMGLFNEFNPDIYINISDFIEEKNFLIKFFKSQNPDYWIEKSELISKLYGSRCNCLFAEGFKKFSYLGYCNYDELL